MKTNTDLERNGVIYEGSESPEQSCIVEPKIEHVTTANTLQNLSQRPPGPKLDIFQQSRTLNSVKMAKDRLVSSHNILKVPIEYEIGSLKPQQADATKLICAVRNFYKHQEAVDLVESGMHPNDVNQNARARRKIKEQFTAHKFKQLDRDLWKVSFIQHQNQLSQKDINSRETASTFFGTTNKKDMGRQRSSLISNGSLQLSQPSSQIQYENKATREKRNIKALDREWIESQKAQVQIGSQLSSKVVGYGQKKPPQASHSKNPSASTISMQPASQLQNSASLQQILHHRGHPPVIIGSSHKRRTSKKVIKVLKKAPEDQSTATLMNESASVSGIGSQHSQVRPLSQLKKTGLVVNSRVHGGGKSQTIGIEKRRQKSITVSINNPREQQINLQIPRSISQVELTEYVNASSQSRQNSLETQPNEIPLIQNPTSYSQNRYSATAQQMQEKRKRSRTAVEGQLRNFMPSSKTHDAAGNQNNYQQIDWINKAKLYANHPQERTMRPNFSGASTTNLQDPASQTFRLENQLLSQVLVNSNSQSMLQNNLLEQSSQSNTMVAQVRRKLAQDNLKKIIQNQIVEQQKLISKKKMEEEQLNSGMPFKVAKNRKNNNNLILAAGGTAVGRDGAGALSQNQPPSRLKGRNQYQFISVHGQQAKLSSKKDIDNRGLARKIMREGTAESNEDIRNQIGYQNDHFFPSGTASSIKTLQLNGQLQSSMSLKQPQRAMGQKSTTHSQSTYNGSESAFSLKHKITKSSMLPTMIISDCFVAKKVRGSNKAPLPVGRKSDFNKQKSQADLEDFGGRIVASSGGSTEKVVDTPYLKSTEKQGHEDDGQEADIDEKQQQMTLDMGVQADANDKDLMTPRLTEYELTMMADAAAVTGPVDQHKQIYPLGNYSGSFPSHHLMQHLSVEMDDKI